MLPPMIAHDVLSNMVSAKVSYPRVHARRMTTGEGWPDAGPLIPQDVITITVSHRPAGFVLTFSL